MTNNIATLIVFILLIASGALLIFLLINPFNVNEFYPIYSGGSQLDGSEDTKPSLVLGNSYFTNENANEDLESFLLKEDNVRYEYDEFYDSDHPELGGNEEEINECKINSDCKDDYYTEDYCSFGDVYSKFHDFSCNKGRCEEDVEKELIEECEFGCSNGECIKPQTQCNDNKDNDNDKLIDAQDPGCWDDLSDPGSYNPELNNESRGGVVCFKNSDCGSDGFIGNNYCDESKVYRDFKTFECKNPGTGVSSCSFTTEKKLIEQCTTQSCNNGMCIGVPSIKILSPLNNSVITTEDVTVTFQAMNWNVGGKGETHVHFHIDNIPGLSFSDHLMFYNGNNKIVELNLEPGTTVFATWINENTIRLNNVPDGTHRIRAHLAKVDHSLPGNPEADTEIVININVNKIICNKDSDCNDNNDYTKDSCVNPGTKDSFCRYEIIECKTDNDCNDNNNKTADSCVNPDTPDSFCFYENIFCFKDSDCGIDHSSDNFCKEGDVYQNTVKFECKNPGTKDSFCREINKDIKKEECSDKACYEGECIQVQCNSNPDCGTNDYTGEKFCKDGDLYQHYKEYMCLNAGNINSSCNSDVKVKLVNDCPNGCFNGQCITEICDDGIDNDGDGKVDDLVELFDNVLLKSFSAQFKGNQGPWEHVTNGDAKAPTLAISGLTPGQLVKVAAITGSYSHRIHNGKDELPSSCKKDTYGTFSDNNKNTVARYPLTIDTFNTGNSFDKGILIPQGATRLYIHILESGSNNYFDNSGNSGNRDNRLPCEVELKTFRVPQCSDGIDNDKDGKIDEDDLGCVNRFDDDEREHDPECRYV